MLDAKIRPLIDPPLNKTAKYLVRSGIQATQISLTGFLFGLFAFILIVSEIYWAAGILIVLNRVCDGLDGAVARASRVTHLGAYLDILLDFLFYSLIILGFAIAQPENAVVASLLLFSFVASGTTFLAHAIFAEKLNLEDVSQGRKSFFYISGLAEGFETIVTLLLICIFPRQFDIIAGLFAVLCLLSAVGRIRASTSMLARFDAQ